MLEEVAYIAYHFHWPYDQVMELEHGERLWWVDEIAKINRRVTELAGDRRETDQWQ